jgi:stress-induced morphogen
MVEPEIVVSKIEGAIEDAEVDIKDMTGTKDHYEVTVVSPAFDGVSRVKQHRMVYDALEDEMEGPIHALSLTTQTPE